MSEQIVNIMTAGHVDHGKTTLLKALTGKWTDEHSEEMKRGITIRLGYANCTIYKCQKCKGSKAYQTTKKCLAHMTSNEKIQEFSFIDVPGHETLMATMLSATPIVDGALLLIAANEGIQPQTKEHLTALEIAGIKNIIIVQNKIDLVDDKQALKNYEEIKDFVKGTIAENAPIIPLSAQQFVNIDVLLEKMIKLFKPLPKNDKADPLMLVARSFDINKPGTNVSEIKGGVIGGSVKQGTFKLGEEVVLLPGIKKTINNVVQWTPIKTRINSLYIGNKSVKKLGPGGSTSIGLNIDPYLSKADSLAGSVLALPGKEPPIFKELHLEIHLMERIVGTSKEVNIEPLRMNEPLVINAWSAKTVGIITSIKGKNVTLKLKLPVCINKNEKVAVSRLFDNRWRLIGWAIVK